MSESSKGKVKREKVSGVSLGLLGLVGIILIVAGVAVSWQRTLIPGSLDGITREITAYEVDQPGVDDRVSMHINDRTIITGNDALVCLSDDSSVAKSSLSRSVEVDGKTCELPLPRQAITDTIVPLLLAGTLVSIFLVRRRPCTGSVSRTGDNS